MNDSMREPWLERSLALLDASLDTLDAATLSRLNQARQRALAHGRRRQRRVWFGVGAVGASAALLLALGLGHRLQRTAAPPAAASGLSAASDGLLTGDDSVDLYEDLDFYAWLDARQDREQD